MQNFKRILVPVDLSQQWERALVHALTLGKQVGTRTVDLLHIPVDAPVTDRDEKLEAFMETEKGMRMKRHMETSDGWGIEVRGRLEFGKAQNVIPMVAAAGAYDLIVMSAYKRTNVSRIMNRGVVAQVVCSGACPVLIIQDTPDARPQPLEEMVCVWNSNFLGDEDTIDELIVGGMGLKPMIEIPAVRQ